MWYCNNKTKNEDINNDDKNKNLHSNNNNPKREIIILKSRKDESKAQFEFCMRCKYYVNENVRIKKDAKKENKEVHKAWLEAKWFATKGSWCLKCKKKQLMLAQC